MKLHKYFCILLATQLFAAVCLAQSKASNTRSYKRAEATNGLQILTIEMPKVPLATIVLVAKAGAMTELPETNGLTHVWEHMFFKGNKRIPNQEAFNKRIRQLGITYNGDTSAEMVRYYFTLPSKNLDDGLQFMADAISTPLLDDKELGRERVVVLDEYDRNASQPGFELFNIERMIMYGAKEHLRNPLGRRRIIETTNRNQLLTIKSDVFVPANSALIVAGDVTAENVKTLVDKHFAAWTTPPDWKPINRGPFPDFPQTTEVTKTHPLAQNVTQQFTWKGPRTLHEKSDTWTADILLQLLEHRSGKFFKKFVDSGLALGAGLSYHSQGQAGELVLYAASRPETASNIRKALLDQPKEWVKSGYFNASQLSDVRRKQRIGYKMELNRPSEYAKTLAFWWATSGLDYYDNYLSNLEKVTLNDVQKFVKKYFIGKPYVGITLLNPEDAKVANYIDNSAPYVEKYLTNY
jgi:zinc protease